MQQAITLQGWLRLLLSLCTRPIWIYSIYLYCPLFKSLSFFCSFSFNFPSSVVFLIVLCFLEWQIFKLSASYVYHYFSSKFQMDFDVFWEKKTNKDVTTQQYIIFFSFIQQLKMKSRTEAARKLTQQNFISQKYKFS